jgi:hypothetical protein
MIRSVTFLMILVRPLFTFLFIIGLSNYLSAQIQKAKIHGFVKDSKNKGIEAVTISILDFPIGVASNRDGYYELEIPANQKLTIVFSHISFKAIKHQLELAPGDILEINKQLQASSTYLNQVVVEEEAFRPQSIARIDPKNISILPSAAGGVEGLLKTLPGVSSNNELSSQYSVRGGNFDENLIYVNDIEIYRPFLVRSGQQEGLSFINSDMVASILFSAGGFDAKYGDKMSSVLDIKYRKPTKFNATANINLLGASLHTEGTVQDYRFTYQLGIRQKSNQYLLGAMETQGEYRPSFTDIQGFFTYDVSDKFELNYLGSVSRNTYRMIPETRQTEFGHVNEALRLTVYFDGQETDQFNTLMNAFSGIYRPNKNLTLKLISSVFNTKETEEFDIQGQYWLDELVKDLGSDEFGNVAFNRGIGTYLNHSRNRLNASVYNLEHKGNLYKNRTNKQWGSKIQFEDIVDRLNSWTMVDSSGYSIPQYPNKEIQLQEVLRTKIFLQSFRYSSYYQETYSWGDTTKYSFTWGSRASYWNVNKELVLSPRTNFAIQPNWKKDILIKFAIGAYHQPPFYRELRDFNGVLNTEVKSQKSIQFLTGLDYNFTAWKRPFKFISEIYYKHITDLIPYEVDNVRIRYFAHNNAKGYASGIDFKVNGEFVKGTESWASLSFMQIREDVLNDYYYDYYNAKGEKIIKSLTFDQIAVDSVKINPGFIPRPSDQLMTFGLFFQDYLPMLPDFKMHLNFLFGTGLPFGPPTHLRYQAIYRMPSYRRVDIGFSYQIVSEEKRPREKSPLRNLKDLWISAEVFNLLQVNNTISYLWVKDVSNQLYAVPNYLTPRLLNLKLIGKF